MLSKLSRLIQSLKSIQTHLVHAITYLEQCERSVSVGDLIDQAVSSIQDIQLKLSDVTQDVALVDGTSARKKRKSEQRVLSTASASASAFASASVSASASASSDLVLDNSSDELIVPTEDHSNGLSGDFYQNYEGPAKLLNRYLIFY